MTTTNKNTQNYTTILEHGEESRPESREKCQYRDDRFERLHAPACCRNVYISFVTHHSLYMVRLRVIPATWVLLAAISEASEVRSSSMTCGSGVGLCGVLTLESGLGSGTYSVSVVAPTLFE